MERESFTSRWGFILSGLGMAIGAGNIWRFPRVAAQNGGGSFLIAWMIALFMWSIPIIILEFAIGRKTRAGVVKSFGMICGSQYCWMGGFVAFCTMAIMFYYSVVTGWFIRYAIGSLKSSILHSDPQIFWKRFISGFEPLFFHIISFLLAGLVVAFGIEGGIERINKILIPLLFLLMFIAALRSIFLPDSIKGIRYLFFPKIENLFDYKTWLSAISQSAWSVGPGWGLILTYAVYSRNEDIVSSSLIIGLGNNLASILAGIAVLCTLFSFLPQDEAFRAVSSGNVGLTFIWLPSLFKKITSAYLFTSIFFISLFFAAFSSLIAMIELAVRVIMDMGYERRKAVVFVVVLGIIFGIPSAISIEFLCNQDWVWGIGLLLSGFFFCLASIRYGISDFRKDLINPHERKIKVGSWFDVLVKYVIPLEFAGLIFWWFYKAVMLFEKWWNPFCKYSLGTCIFQWGILIFLLLILNDKIAKRYKLKKIP